MITICGLGTLGSHLAEHLARSLSEPLTLIDFDRVERRNLGNQAYHSAQVGQPKARALAELLYRAKGVRARHLECELTPSKASSLLEGSHLVVDAFDNRPARLAVQATCRSLGLPCLHLGLSPEGYAEVIWDEHYEVPPQVERDPCAEPSSRGLALLVTAVAASSLEAFLTGRGARSYSVTLSDLCVSPLPMAPVSRAAPDPARATINSTS